MPQFRRGDDPPPPGPRSPILRLRANQRGILVVFSATWTSVVSHWDGSFKPKGRSFPCELPEKPCPYCEAEVNKRWRAYVHSCLTIGASNQLGFFELTQNAVEQIKSDCGVNVSIRGERFQVERGGADNSRLTMRRIASWSAVSDKPLPPEEEPDLELMRLWGLVKRRFPHNRSA